MNGLLRLSINSSKKIIPQFSGKNQRSLVSFGGIFGDKNEQSEEVTFKNSPVEKVDRIEKEGNRTVNGQIRLTKVKAYVPDENVENQIKAMSQEIFKENFDENTYQNIKLSDPLDKFNLLTKCIAKFDHNISNTALNDIKTIKDLITYYQAEVKDTSKLEDLHRNPELPENLHINLEYNRYDPATDDFFNGRDAFKNRDTLSTSLWYSKKYKSIVKKKEFFSK